jgi:hypothetical protein
LRIENQNREKEKKENHLFESESLLVNCCFQNRARGHSKFRTSQFHELLEALFVNNAERDVAFRDHCGPVKMRSKRKNQKGRIKKEESKRKNQKGRIKKKKNYTCNFPIPVDPTILIS